MGGGRRGGAVADQPEPRAKGPWLTRKVGPLPVWAYGLIAVGGWYWYTHYGPGASKQKQPAGGGGGGLKTYAPRITETIVYGRRGKQKPRRPKPPRSAGAGLTGGPMMQVNPGGPMQPGPPPVNPGGPMQPPPRRKPPPPPAPPPAPPPRIEQTAAQAYAPGPPTGGPVSADTGQPVYWEWTHAHRGPEVAEPVAAYAPMTSGAVYDAASAAAATAG
jgi:hypothetical protein